MKAFKKKVIMVIGGSSGIGLHLVKHLLSVGAYVSLLDTKRPNLSHKNLAFFFCDITKDQQVKKAIKNSIEHYGKLDAAVNNAGVGGDFNLVEHYSAKNWEKVISVNLSGVFRCMKYQLAHFSKVNKGAIVNTASLLSIVGYANDSAYVASKHGVIGLTKSAALEYAPIGIRINCVSPGFTDTPMTSKYEPNKKKELEEKHALGRFARPTEIVNGILWLLSDEASFVTGHNLVIDGGYTIQ